MTPLDEAIDAAKSFETIKEFRKAHSALYCRIAKAKAYEQAFKHMRRIRVTQDMYEGGRHCAKCKVKQSIDKFLFVGKGQSRRRSICLNCHNAECAAWRSKNLDRAREIVSASAKLDPKKVRERQKAKRLKSPEAFAARYMLKRVLRLTGARKNTKTERSVGYTAQELRAHIASQFEYGMTWDNWGEWHIDHIKPVAQLIREGITCPAKINALSNLRPLWAQENLSKVWEARGDNRKHQASA
jgi:hypothetical protein